MLVTQMKRYDKLIPSFDDAGAPLRGTSRSICLYPRFLRSRIAHFGNQGLIIIGTPLRGAPFSLAARAVEVATSYNRAELAVASYGLEGEDQYLLKQCSDRYARIYRHHNKKFCLKLDSRTTPLLVCALQQAVRKHSYVERDGEAMEQLRCIMVAPTGYRTSGGTPWHLALARALACWLMQEGALKCYQPCPPPPRLLGVNWHKRTSK